MCEGPDAPPSSDPSPAGLVAEWTFDDQQDPTLDETGTYLADLLTGAGFATDDLPPIADNVAALELNGSTCAEAPDPGGDHNLDGFDAMTLAAWVKPDYVSGAQILITKYHSASPVNSISYWLLLRNSAIEVFVASHRGIGAEMTSEGVSVLPGQWSHVAGTWDGENLRLFLNGVEVDGQLKSSDGVPTVMDDSSVPVTLGCAQAFGNGQRSAFLHGSLDSATIFDVALSPDDIRALALS